MIDPTKPIRRKGGAGEEQFVATPECVYRVHSQTEAPQIGERWTQELLDLYFENIPEPRKPREWWGTVTGDGIYASYPKDMGTGRPIHADRVVNLIEWPEGAPLPDLPEGA